MDAISKHAETHGKTTTKDAKGNTYILLETASIDCDSTAAVLSEERGTENDGDSGAPPSSTEKRNSDKPVDHHREEVVETSGAVHTRGNRSANSVTSPPAEVERCVSASTEGVSTHTAAEMAKRKDTKQTNTNVSDSIHILTSKYLKLHVGNTKY